MNSDFRNRVFLPLVMPLGILLLMAAFIGVFALTLLYGTHDMSLALAAVAAFGILFTISLAASQDRLDPARRGVLAVAVAVPFVLGGLYATGIIGDIGDEDRMINVEPDLEVPDDAILAAENDQEFCEYDAEADACGEPTELWEVAQQDAEDFVYQFVNFDPGPNHNLSIRELEGDVESPEAGEVLHSGEVIGVGDVVETVEGGLEVGEYYFVCDLHPATMTGALVVTEGGADGEGGEEA